jgi:hypothetical protein
MEADCSGGRSSPRAVAPRGRKEGVNTFKCIKLRVFNLQYCLNRFDVTDYRLGSRFMTCNLTPSVKDRMPSAEGRRAL